MVIIGKIDEVLATLKTLCVLYGCNTPVRQTVATVKIDHREK